ncbi:dimethylhistidine N-methyltransferase [Capsulimonas corticalis]|uniref:Dimethylhistidine N-methyltransferase n=1 Tax=Capsulimonas corticalis TaxID=2219043 RepID=A0A402D4D6_9BACT|nr:L-histidine N(alpha)-methyltransferase [Capsulimonas corticalis]BDI29158.1 dimethylhistidine N-methyltransferase [Capsulimonas corticalis]
MPLLERTRAAAHAGDSEVADFYAEVIAGLTMPVKTLPCKYFYDERGSQLFDEICELDEYYPTRTEAAIMERCAAEMAALLGPDCRLVEYGSGSSTKTRILLDSAPHLAAYVPVDISRVHLQKTAEGLRRRYPRLEILPVCADYTASFTLPEPSGPVSRTVAYFPGSTIGNFHPRQAQFFLTQIAQLCGEGGGLLIGVDLKKDPAVLHAAYNDAKGVTAAFNLNVLDRINQELRGAFVLDDFAHHAFYNEELGRIEMHLVSQKDQTVAICESAVTFAAGETIHTECSYKYSREEFAELARSAGFEIQNFWTDPNELFSVQYLTVAR